jgi:hypothetical protein
VSRGLRERIAGRAWLVGKALAALDVALAASAGLALLQLTTGGFDLGFFSVRRFSKPFLVFVALGSVRAAIHQGSWLTRLIARLAGPLRRQASVVGAGPLGQALHDSLAAFVPVLVGTKLVAFLANVLLPQVQARGVAMPFESTKFAEAFAAWDSGWYWTIARDGYRYAAHDQSTIAFFPLYPLLMRALAWPFGGGDRALWIAGIVASLACFFLALVVLHRLTERLCGSRESARRTVLYVAVFPFAIFFTQVYTESLFLLLSVSAMLAAYGSRWPLAGLLGGLTALTRPNGILIALPLGLLALAERPRPRPRELLQRLAAVSAVPLALLGFCLFARARTGDPLAWLHAQSNWGYSLGNPPWTELMRVLDGLAREGPYDYFFSHPLAVPYLMHGFVALCFLALVPSVFARLGPALGAYVAVSLLVPLTGNALEGIGRYAATLFPVFMLLGAMTSRRVHEALLIVGSLGLALLSALLVAQYKVY